MDLNKRFELMGLTFKDISGRTSHIHQWHTQHEGVKDSNGFEEQVEKNKEYFFGNNSIVRNLGGWGNSN